MPPSQAPTSPGVGLGRGEGARWAGLRRWRGEWSTLPPWQCPGLHAPCPRQSIPTRSAVKLAWLETHPPLPFSDGLRRQTREALGVGEARGTAPKGEGSRSTPWRPSSPFGGSNSKTSCLPPPTIAQRWFERCELWYAGAEDALLPLGREHCGCTDSHALLGGWVRNGPPRMTLPRRCDP